MPPACFDLKSLTVFGCIAESEKKQGPHLPAQKQRLLTVQHAEKQSGNRTDCHVVGGSIDFDFIGCIGAI